MRMRGLIDGHRSVSNNNRLLLRLVGAFAIAEKRKILPNIEPLSVRGFSDVNA